METADSSRDIPVQLTDGPRLRALNDALMACGYTAEGVCERMGIDSIYDYEGLAPERSVPASVDDPLDVLIHLFLACRSVSGQVVETVLPEGLPDLLREHGLIADDPEEPGIVEPAVMFYPAEGLLLASDLAGRPLSPDAVYPAIAANTGELIALMPDDPSAAFLDMCSGTAIAGILSARRSERSGGHAWAVDVTTRATRFAEFNAALNATSNVTILEGDVWDPVADLDFDLIFAHPPYVPTVESDLIYRAGGEDGEQVSRRILAGLERHLRPGGRFLCSCMLSDRTDQPVEQRIRAMIGPTNSQFDVYVLARAETTPETYFERHAVNRHGPTADTGLVDRLRALGVERLVLGVVVIDRHASDRPAVTARRSIGAAVRRDALDWVVEWERAAIDPGMPDRVMNWKPRLAGGVRLEIVSRPGSGEWVPIRCRIRSEWPIPRVIEVPGEIADFLTSCDGTSAFPALRSVAARAGLVPSDMTDADFVLNLLPLIGSGVLLFED